MNVNLALIKLGCLAIIVGLLQACATGNSNALNTDTQQTEQNEEQVWLHTVRPHDSLSEIAFEYTGNANNRLAIAKFNRLPAYAKLRLGTTIAIPGSLVKIELQIQRERKSLKPSEMIASIDRQSKTSNSQKNNSQQANTGINPTFVPTTLAVRRGNGSSTQSNDVVVRPVLSNRSFDLTPITGINADSGIHHKGHGDKVKVVGTYSPKGIYAEPNNYSQLIGRVFPGTLLDLEYYANDWYKIKTSNGSIIDCMENRLLTLVRHAKSSWNVQGQQDHERPLNERGMRDAPVMAQRLLDRRCIPDLILCSSAVRTQQTAQYFLKALELSHDQLWVEPKLYLCSPETILNEVAVAEAGNTHVMVIAHNPGLEQLSALLSSECQQAMPTLGIRHFACSDYYFKTRLKIRTTDNGPALAGIDFAQLHGRTITFSIIARIFKHAAVYAIALIRRFKPTLSRPCIS